MGQYPFFSVCRVISMNKIVKHYRAVFLTIRLKRQFDFDGTLYDCTRKEFIKVLL